MTPPSPLLASLYVALGGGTGAVLRFQLGRLVTHWFGPNLAFPWATFAANVIGSLSMGLLVGMLARHGHGGELWRLLLGVGLLGGFTTFSSFSMEMVLLTERGAIGMAAAYAGFSLLAGFAAMFIGLVAMRVLA